MECFVLLSIMMNSQQPIGEEDINEAIKAYGDNPSFLKKILEGSKTRKKVENFLGQQQMMANLTPNFFGVPPEVREANKFMTRYTKGDFSDPEFIKNFQIISNYNKGIK